MSIELAMYRGDDRTFPFTITLDGVPVDLTGAALTFSAKADLDDVDPSLTLDGAAITIEDQTTDPGLISVAIPSSATQDLDPGLLLCDIAIDLGGSVWTWPEAKFGDSTLIRLRIKADVTRPA